MRTRAFRIVRVSSLAATVLALASLLQLHPKDALDAALNGVAIWWDVLFPALFPFFVVSELMLGVGIVHFFGTLLDPMMRPLFRIPGPGGFVMAMGFASGYPVAAKLTSQLWDQRMLSRNESERLVAFTTTADPIFLIGAVSVGFFHNASLAAIFAISHYGGAVLVGLLLRMRSRRSPSPAPKREEKKGRSPIVQRAFEAMHFARLQDGRTLGSLLRDGIQSGLQLIIVVGGLVVFFSVVIELLTLANIINAIQLAIGAALALFGLPSPLSSAIVNGLFEVTLGAKAAGSAEGMDLRAQVAVAAFGLSWAGLSVHAQVMSIVSHMPVRYVPFSAARLVHGLLSGVIAYTAWNFLLPIGSAAAAWLPAGAEHPGWETAYTWAPLSALLFFGTLALLPILFVLRTLAVEFIHRFRI